jgi:hypothetical protein
VDARIFDTQRKWEDYCEARGLANPFQEEQELYKLRCVYKDENGWKVLHVRDLTEEEEALLAQIKRWKKEYLRLQHEFELWDFHFWMEWEEFAHWLKEYGSEVEYLPCDCGSRQCALTCQYFGEKCPRESGELESPINGLDRRWEIGD